MVQHFLHNLVRIAGGRGAAIKHVPLSDMKLRLQMVTIRRFVPQLSDFHPDVALFTDEIRRYNDSVRFHTPHGANYMEFFRRKDGGEWRVPERIATPIAGDPGYVMPRPA